MSKLGLNYPIVQLPGFFISTYYYFFLNTILTGKIKNLLLFVAPLKRYMLTLTWVLFPDKQKTTLLDNMKSCLHIAQNSISFSNNFIGALERKC